jgi:parallel beta-helix repeat protein
MENGWDFARVEISRDGGLTWDRLNSFTGSSGGWVLENLGLNDYSGDIIIRFRVTSDANLGLAGWYIDNISLTNHDYQDLESDSNDGWTHGGTGDTWERGFPYSGPWATLSGDNVWGTKLFGEYQDNGDCSLYSPQFDLHEGTTLSFWHWYDIEAGWDTGYLEISDDEISWDSLASYDGTLDDWELVEISLGGYSGSVQIRFRLQTDGSETFDGWYIDDISFLGSGGIHLETSDGNTLSKNTCIETGGNGILLVSSVNNTLKDNNCSNNQKNGIYSESSNNNEIIRNSASDNLKNGIYSVSSNNNYIHWNFVSYNLENGIFLNSSSGNKIENNTVHRSIDGILIEDSTSNKLYNNTVSDNQNNGIKLDRSNDSLIIKNTCSRNFEGIYLDYSDSCTLSKNLCTNNRDNGIYLISSYSDLVSNKCINNTWNGISILDYYGVIWDNECRNNSQTGIYVEDALLSDISWNTCVNNYFGIIIKAGSAYNWIDNNTSNNNEYYGMTLYDSCFNNTVENNSLKGSRFGLFIYQSHNNTLIFNNLINNTEYGINITDPNSRHNTIHHNNFLYNNGSSYQAYDNGLNNSWDDGNGEGNFWDNYSSLYPQATNDEHVWNKPYNISGPANGSDRYPLFYAGPGADTELPRLVVDNTPAQATTGDTLSFSAEFEDNLGIVTVHVLYSYDGLNWQNNETMVLTRGGIWSYSTTINTDATEFFYMFYLTDMGRNHVFTTETQLEILDNDPPELIADETQDKATTKDRFVFSVKLGDNVRIVSAIVHYSYNGVDYDNENLRWEMGNTWSTYITIPEDATVLYYYFVYSDGTNVEETTINTVIVTDNDAPLLVSDNTPLQGNTGDPFTFDIMVTDNYKLESVFVHYSHDDKVYQTRELTDEGTGFWKEEITLELNFTKLYYYFKISDNSILKNELTTDKVEIPVIDNDPPTARAGEDLIVEQNTEVILDGSSSTDNIGIDKYSWKFIYDGVENELNDELEEFTFEIPGKYLITLFVSDEEGNRATDILNITVIDDSKPLADAGDDITTDQHEEVTLSGKDSSDNIELAGFTWTFVYNGENITLQGEIANFVFDIAGLYIITLNVTDAGGNWAADTLKVIVNDIEKPIANAGDDQRVEEGTTVLLNGGNSTDNDAIVSFLWSFHYDGLERPQYGENTTFRFKISGEYSITLTVTDGAGNSAIDTLKINVIEKSSADDDELPDFWNNTVDEDKDGLDDRWEEYYFGGNISPHADADADGYMNIHEYKKKTDPTKKNIKPADIESGSNPDDKKASSGDWWTWILMVGILFLILVVILFLIIRSRRSKDGKENDVPEIDVDHGESFDDAEESDEDDIEVFSSPLDTDPADPEFEKLADTYNNCKEYGMAMGDYESRFLEIEKAVKLGEEDVPESITAFITEMDDAYYSYYEDLKKNTKKLHMMINTDFKKAMGSGLDIGQLRPDYEAAIEYFKGGDFHGAKELFTLVKSNLDKALSEKLTGEEENTDSVKGEKTEKKKLDLDSLFNRILPPAGPRKETKEFLDEDDNTGSEDVPEVSGDEVKHPELVAVNVGVSENDETNEQEVGILSPIVEEEDSE